MAISFSQYSKVYNEFCISYSGSHREHALLLMHFRNSLEKYYSCNIHLALNPKFLHLCDYRCFDSNLLQKKKYEFGYVFNIKLDPKVNPFFDLVKHTPRHVFSFPKKEHFEKTIICPSASFPHRDMSEEEISFYKNKFKNSVVVKNPEEIPEKCNLVGVSGEVFWTGVLKGLSHKLVISKDDLYNFLFL